MKRNNYSQPLHVSLFIWISFSIISIYIGIYNLPYATKLLKLTMKYPESIYDFRVVYLMITFSVTFLGRILLIKMARDNFMNVKSFFRFGPDRTRP